jgi:hypothetical protein
MPNVHELIRDHVTLSIRCLDRLYLHASMPKLQTSGGLCYFLRDHLGHPIPSPALFAPMRERFVSAIKTYATTQDIPLITFERGPRKDDVVATHRAQRPLKDGVVVIGVAQERMRAFKAHKLSGRGKPVSFDFSRQSVAVNHYYFYVQDPDWGPAFLTMGTYLPYPIKLCVNGHEWVKQPPPATQRPHPPRPQDPSLHRHHLWAQSRLLLRQALFARSETRVDRATPHRRPAAAPASHRP